MSLENNESKVIQGRFQLTKKLGAGSFGEIFEARDLKTGKVYACKAESIRTKHPQLRLEYQIYRTLQRSPHFVKVWGYVQHFNHQIMIMDKLGDSLEQLFTLCNRQFTIGCVCKIAIQILSRIQELHEHHYLHRDIKPDNFLIGIGDLSSAEGGKVYMIDLGLGKLWKENGRHIPEKRGKRLIGTPRYASIKTHFGHEQSRRDDLESLGYMLMYFVKGTLPWQGLRGQTKEEKYQKIGQKKRETQLSQLCAGFPPEFCQYLSKCQNLRFTEQPPYSEFRELFERVLRRQPPNQKCFDWQRDKIRAKKGERSPATNNKIVQHQQQQRISRRKRINTVNIPNNNNINANNINNNGIKTNRILQPLMQSTNNNNANNNNINTKPVRYIANNNHNIPSPHHPHRSNLSNMRPNRINTLNAINNTNIPTTHNNNTNRNIINNANNNNYNPINRTPPYQQQQQQTTNANNTNPLTLPNLQHHGHAHHQIGHIGQHVHHSHNPSTQQLVPISQILGNNVGGNHNRTITDFQSRYNRCIQTIQNTQQQQHQQIAINPLNRRTSSLSPHNHNPHNPHNPHTAHTSSPLQINPNTPQPSTTMINIFPNNATNANNKYNGNNHTNYSHLNNRRSTNHVTANSNGIIMDYETLLMHYKKLDAQYQKLKEQYQIKTDLWKISDSNLSATRLRLTQLEQEVLRLRGDQIMNPLDMERPLKKRRLNSSINRTNGRK